LVRSLDARLTYDSLTEHVSPGDWVMGDIDGVVFIPAVQANAVFRAALDKIAAEDTTRAELEAGEKLHAVYARHGVL
jgi:4-hydroxy-4-methyl-2-oxoglutarate aldolase